LDYIEIANLVRQKMSERYRIQYQARHEERVPVMFKMLKSMKVRLLEAVYRERKSMSLYLREVIERYFERNPIIPQEFDPNNVQRKRMPLGDFVWQWTALPERLYKALKLKATFERKSMSLVIHEILKEHFEREAIKKEIIS